MTVYAWLYLIPAFFAFFWPIAILVVKEHPSRAQWIVSASLFLVGCSMVLYSTYFNEKLETEYFLSFLASIVSLYCAPLFYIYVCYQTSMVGISYKAKRIFLPSVIMSSIISVVALIGKASYYKLFLIRAVHGNNLSLMEDWKYDLFVIFNYYGYLLVITLQIIFVITFACFRMLQYDRLLNDYYDSNNHVLASSKKFIMLCSILTISVTLIISSHPIHEIKILPIVVIISLIECFVLWLIGWYTYNLRYTADELSDKLKQSDLRYKEQTKSLKDDYVFNNIRRDFVELVEKKQLFLNPNISLEFISDRLHVSQNLLVDFINQIYGCTFAEYIDGLRVSKAVGMIMVELKNKKNDTLNSRLTNVDYIESVARQCGFNSIVSFYAGFKLVMGQSYDSWIRES